ncbi:MAG: Gfo/Idh/MocA family oxidoreductase, partial [Planctomycetota bacterium]
MSNELRPVRVGVLGCGNISSAYFKNAANFNVLDIVAVADLKREVAQAQADEYGIGTVLTPDELIASDEVEVVLNLTIPHVHVETMLAALDAGKHTFCEKPLGVDRDDGRKVLDKAAETGLLVGVAPDTVLGSGIQTARKAIDDGIIGTPTAVTAIMAGGGHESWHPSPVFYYKPGGGPMFDMGPYYLTAMLQMLGPIERVSGFANIA